jgi:predicted enzyme related to lactoylglutathione lyase
MRGGAGCLSAMLDKGGTVALKVDWITIDCRDAVALAEFWKAALDYRALYSSPPDEDEDEVLLGPKSGRGPRLLLLETPDEKKTKNRLHLDLRPDDRDAEVERLVALGARRIDIGQGEGATWVVLADPEGNEFCILRALTEEEKTTHAWAAD